jgi:hypothetical protein
MKNFFTIFLFWSLLAVSPAFGQSALLVARTYINVDGTGIPYSGDSTTFAYNNQLLTNQLKTWQLDPEGNWDQKNRSTDHTYDANGNLLYYLFQVGDDVNGWTDANRYTYTYAMDGNELSYLAEKWNGTAWVKQSSSRIRVYDANGNLLSQTGTSQRTLYTYDAENLVQTKTIQELLNSNWVDKSRVVYSYLPNNTTIETTAYWIGTGWFDTNRNTITYNASGKVLQNFSESWNSTVWINGSLQSNSYTANGDVLEELTQSWNGTDWENYYLTSYSYDTENNLSDWISFEWDDSTWTGTFRQFNGFDDENRSISIRLEVWDGTDWGIFTYGNFYYDEFVSTQTLSPANFEVFPNPASSWITLKGEGFLHAYILDQQGRPVHTQRLNGQGDQTIQVGNLPTGNYLLQVIGVDGTLGVKSLQIMR